MHVALQVRLKLTMFMLLQTMKIDLMIVEHDLPEWNSKGLIDLRWLLATMVQVNWSGWLAHEGLPETLRGK